MLRRFTRLTAILALLLLAALPALAKWSYIPVSDLVRDSDLIVVATLQNVSEFSREGRDLGSGTLVVQKSLWGDVAPGTRLRLQWDNDSQIACPRIEHRYSANRESVWLLTWGECNTVRADYPGRTLETAAQAKVKQILRSSFVRLALPEYALPLGKPAVARLVYRNPTDQPLVFPGADFRSEWFLAHSGVRISLRRDTGSETTPASWKRLPSKRILPTQETVTLPVGAERTVLLDINTLFGPLIQGSYKLNWEIKGYGKGEANFSVVRPEEYARWGSAQRHEEGCTSSAQQSASGKPLVIACGIDGKACRRSPNPAVVWLTAGALWLGWRLLKRPEIVTRFPQ